ncbi:MAG: O-succinylhomoserine sulfhydrylase [Cardiobacteriaceae bacterium]|nr:O-succinylhomoserine sulfhydrylase [Cardiobacteriaceae bacterium]
MSQSHPSSAESSLPSDSLHFETLAIRDSWWQSQANEHSQALMLTSSYTFQNAQEAADIFGERKQGYSYSRFLNPTVEMFEKRLATLEGAARCTATATGMSAILSLAMYLLKAGDHIICARNSFGSTLFLFNQIFNRFNIETTLVELTDLNEWQSALRPNTKMLFLETPANPLLSIADISALADLAHRHGAKLVVDNCFATPALQQPFKLGADFVVHSATKYLDGQGRIMGGAVLSREAEEGEGLYRLLRSIGTTMGAFEAWICLKSLETLGLRMKAHSHNALLLAEFLSKHPKVERVYYPGLNDHPQHQLAKAQMPNGFGGMVAFDVKGGLEAAWRVIDNAGFISISGNLGDARSIITHPYTTTHARVSPEDKAKVGISEGTIRLSVGLEDSLDLISALGHALNKA